MFNTIPEQDNQEKCSKQYLKNQVKRKTIPEHK